MSQEENQEHVGDDSELVDDSKIYMDKPPQEIGAIITGDGAPVEISHRIKDAEAAKGSKIYENCQFLPGGFHANLEIYRMKNKLSQDIFGFFVGKWRSGGAIKWIMEPSDPNDLENELYQYVAAHYCAAAFCLKKINSIENDGDRISPVDVNMHMIDQAESYPLCMATLLDLRFAEVSIMVRDSEKSNNVDIFVASIQLVLPLFTVIHVVKYVRICTEFLQWWETASNAMQLVFRKFIFTKKHHKEEECLLIAV